jgi:hypothetical protein
MGVSKRREEIRSSVHMAFLSLTHVSCLRHRSPTFEVYVHASCIILNLICNRIFLYVRFTEIATRTYVLRTSRYHSPSRRILLVIVFVPGARYHLSYCRLDKVKVLGCPVSPVHDIGSQDNL